MAVPSPAAAPLRVVTPAGRGWAVDGFGADRLAGLIAADDCPDPAAVVMKAGTTATVLRGELVLEGGPAAVCWKRVRRKTFAKRLATAVRTRRPVLTYCHAARLRAAGVRTPRPLACTTPKRRHVHRPAWLLTEWVEGTEDLAVADRRLAGLPPRDRLRLADRLAGEVGKTLGRLHAAGATHRDLKPNNVLVTKLSAEQARDPAAEVTAWVIDLDAVAFPALLTDRRRRKDLARLRRGLPHLMPGLLRRFGEGYREGFGGPPPAA